MYTIYRAYNIIEKKSYVGMTKRGINTRRSWHYSASKKACSNKFHDMLSKFKREDVIWTVLDTTEDREEAKRLEVKYTLSLNCLKEGYNQKLGFEAHNKGKKMREDLRLKYLVGKNNPMYGTKWSEEKRKAFSDRMKECQFGRNNPIARKIYRVSDGKIWYSIIECSKETGIPATSIGKCCSGANKTAYGSIFKYCDK